MVAFQLYCMGIQYCVLGLGMLAIRQIGRYGDLFLFQFKKKRYNDAHVTTLKLPTLPLDPLGAR